MILLAMIRQKKAKGISHLINSRWIWIMIKDLRLSRIQGSEKRIATLFSMSMRAAQVRLQHPRLTNRRRSKFQKSHQRTQRGCSHQFIVNMAILVGRIHSTTQPSSEGNSFLKIYWIRWAHHFYKNQKGNQGCQVIPRKTGKKYHWNQSKLSQMAP